MDNDIRMTLDALDNIIERLSDPLLPSDIRHGWSERSQAAILKYYQRIRTRIELGENIPRGEINGLARGLDSWGVDGGMLQDSTFGVSGILRRDGFPFVLGDKVPPSKMIAGTTGRKNLIAVVRILSERLADSLLPSDLRHGWTEEQKGRVAEYFSSLGARLANGENCGESDLALAEAILRELPGTGQLASDVAYGVESLRQAISVSN